MKIFIASIATETNTFSPLRTDFSDFAQSFYAPPGQHPESPTLCSAIFPVCRRRSAAEGWELVEGTATWAEPGGIVNNNTYYQLRDEILGQLKAAMPVDAVILGFLGAMVAQDIIDCEGDLLAAVRELVGSDCVIGATFDPHSHLTPQRLQHSDILVAFKEFPHTDFVDAAENCVELVIRTVNKEIKPVKAAYDCKMIEIFPTDQKLMRAFVDDLLALEQQQTVLSASVIHGFMAGDVPELGARIVIITDNDPVFAAAKAKELGLRLYAMRGATRPSFYTPDDAIEEFRKDDSYPVVMADVWDNPGGGTPGDSTLLLQSILDAGLQNVAVATIWDPMAVKLCISAGEGATLPLRFGGKTSATGGLPIDAEVTVKCVQTDAWQSFGSSKVPLGDSAVICFQGIELILNSNRCQAFSPNIFSNLGIDPLEKSLLVVKSTNHFHDAFAPIAKQIIYVDVEGPYPSNPKTNDYKNLSRAVWPRCENPEHA